jgi:hypothetical protein
MDLRIAIKNATLERRKVSPPPSSKYNFTVIGNRTFY